MFGSISNSSVKGAGDDAELTYYPPRAHGRTVGHRFWWGFLRFCRVPGSRVFVPEAVSADFFTAFFLPGYGLVRAGLRWEGYAAMVVSFLSALTFFVFFGQSTAWLAASILMTIHVIGHAVLLQKARVVGRFLAGLISTIAILSLVYFPIQHLLRKCFLPLQTAQGVVVVKRPAPEILARGDFVAVRYSATAKGPVRMREGVGLERILAGPGDVVEFRATTFLVNGRAFPRRADMPESGTIRLEAGHWFVWPTVAVANRGASSEALSEIMVSYSVVPRSAILGIPCKRWFGRETLLP